MPKDERKKEKSKKKNPEEKRKTSAVDRQEPAVSRPTTAKAYAVGGGDSLSLLDEDVLVWDEPLLAVAAALPPVVRGLRVQHQHLPFLEGQLAARAPVKVVKGHSLLHFRFCAQTSGGKRGLKHASNTR